MPCQRFTPAIWAVSVLINHPAKASLFFEDLLVRSRSDFHTKKRVEEPSGSGGVAGALEGCLRKGKD